jgi:hypothetical protein
MIQERCGCGGSFKTDEPNSVRLVREWRKNHKCEISEEVELRDIETTSTIGFSSEYKGTGLDLPAKEYDPWEDE